MASNFANSALDEKYFVRQYSRFPRIEKMLIEETRISFTGIRFMLKETNAGVIECSLYSGYQ